jgi:hypothetical protein
MKDLYKHIGLTTLSSDFSRIRRVIEECNAPAAIKEASRHILLVPIRKDIYDRNHKVLTTIGHIRAELGLNQSKRWLECNCEDFTFENTDPKVDSGK